MLNNPTSKNSFLKKVSILLNGYSPSFFSKYILTGRSKGWEEKLWKHTHFCELQDWMPHLGSILEQCKLMSHYVELFFSEEYKIHLSGLAITLFGPTEPLILSDTDFKMLTPLDYEFFLKT
jgi:hypothetical protein